MPNIKKRVITRTHEIDPVAVEMAAEWVKNENVQDADSIDCEFSQKEAATLAKINSNNPANELVKALNRLENDLPEEDRRTWRLMPEADKSDATVKIVTDKQVKGEDGEVKRLANGKVKTRSLVSHIPGLYRAGKRAASDKQEEAAN